ncbi:endonuclease/exonuclease/phosphatase family protein [Kaistella sp. G5-32]|uniref:Endonuclease/exonuclease/phosphatase family protein n=1 Tax=Kaistella gelatinilytica TaxID=2787636 RepID=A0ABS0F7S0_9FLAO|nr:endonuclease/exonuclease/phosphatase family protein [Kaistella gelatinilytica]MBF8455750.1 endonuclease/exonuclease/phosphatase family protein [Kaistella gelatinilytica]
MKILTWNLERPKDGNPLILNKLKEVNADVLILTETNIAIHPGSEYSCVSTEILPPDFDGIKYASGENRTTVWSKYNIKEKYETYDDFTSVSAAIKVEETILNVYGTIIGVFGGKGERFKTDLESQLLDFDKFSSGNFTCIAGDFNVMFSGFAYPSHDARNKLNSIFQKLNLINLTSQIENNVDHIVISKDFIAGKEIKIETWNEDKTLSDHIGICIEIR